MPPVLSLVADEDFSRTIFTGLRRREPRLNIVRVQDVGLRTASDAAVLAWAAQEGRLVVTHDLRTMPGAAYARMERGDPMSGLIVVRKRLPISEAIDQLPLISLADLDDEWESRVLVL